jgi:aminomethyltransferase
MSQPEKTPFYERHLRHKGKMVDYSGWNLPVQFEGIVAEVLKTRQQAGLFDVSHMGEVMVRGRDALTFLQRIATNDLAALKDGRVMYSPVCYPDGGTVDDILVYRYDQENYLLVVNAGNARKDYQWFQEHLAGDVTLTDLSPETAQLALQGPLSQEILTAVTRAPLAALKYYRFLPEAEVGGVRCLVSRTGYTGEDGFELYCSREDALKLWDALWEAGEPRGLAPVGLGARDILRLEASLPLYGHELSTDLSPLEAGLDRFVSFTKEPAFIGRDALQKRREEGPTKKLAGIEMLERGIPREGYPILAAGREIGWVSSGTYSPTLDKNVAMVFLEPQEAVVGREVRVAIRTREYPAQVVKLPFYRRG